MKTIFITSCAALITANIALGDTYVAVHDGMRFTVEFYPEDGNHLDFAVLQEIENHDRAGILTIPDSVYFEGLDRYRIVDKIATSVLQDLPNVTEIFFPENLYAFHPTTAPKNCPNLEAIHLRKKFNSLSQQNLLYGLTELREINIEEGNPYFRIIDGVVYNADLSKLNVMPPALNKAHIEVPEGCTEIVTSAFQNCRHLQSVCLPESLETIQQFGFSDCESLESFTMPSAVTMWGNNIFSKNKALQSAVINDLVTSVPLNAFINCTNLKTVVIGENVQKIYNNAFNPCWKLETITVKAQTPPAFTGTQWFYEPIYDTCDLIVPYGCGEAYRNAEVWKNFKKIIDPAERVSSVEVAQGEYFIDTDPGVGKANHLEAAQGENYYSLPLEGFSPGAHIFGIRAMDNSGRWTATVTHPLYISDEMLYADMEYYIDEDPGKGKGKPVKHGHSRIVRFDVATDNIPVGTHTLSVRLLDPQGKWGEVMTRPFVITQKAPDTDLILEYFYDKDPGVGAARKVAVSEGNNIFYLPLDDSLNAGSHIFGVRCMDKKGIWTQTVVNPLYLVDKVEMSKGEYYVDSDPGEGKANGIAIGTDGKAAFTVPASNLSLGTHQLVFRGLNADNQWITLFSRPFEVSSNPTGITDIQWRLGFSCKKTPAGIEIDSQEIPDGSMVSVYSLNGILLAEILWPDTSLPLFINLDNSQTMVVKILTPEREISSKILN